MTTRAIEGALGRRSRSLLVNAVLIAAQPGLALPGPLGSYFFGPKLVRAEVLVKDGGALHLYRVDRGVIGARPTERSCFASATAASSTIAVAPTATITIGGRPAAYADSAPGNGRHRDP